MGAFAWNAAALPYAVVSLATLVLAVIVALTRGDLLVRFSMMAILLIALAYIGGTAALLACTDPELAARISRVQVGPIALLGPAMMLGILSINGLVERYRWLLVGATALSLVSTTVALSTDLVIRGAWMTDWNLWFVRAGPLNDVHVGQFVGWAVAGAVLARRASVPATAKQVARRRRFMAVLVIGIFGVTDAALAHGHGVYPFSFVPASAAIALGYAGVLRHDILRSRGFDKAMALELLVLAVLTVVVALAWVELQPDQSIGRGLIASGTLVGLLALAQLTVSLIRKGRLAELREAEVDERSLEEFVEAATRTRSEADLAALVREVLVAQLGLERGLLYVDQEGALVAEEGQPVAVDRRVRAWLSANRRPLMAEDLTSRRLGGLREPIAAFITNLGGEVVVPVVDRGGLVGVITSAAARGGRALRDDEAEVLMQIASASGRALAYLAVFREAAERVEVAKEVEVASAVQAARAGEAERLRFDGCEIDTHFQAATQFGGDWWASHELSDGRLLVAIGDVTGHGVPAALVSFTVEGACDTAQRMFGASLELVALMKLLNESVREVGRDTYSMTCFAALFDFDDSTVTFCNAGHPFPYVVRKNGDGVELRSLVSRGTPLGTEDPILSVSRMELEPEDVVIFYSDALVESRDPDGVPFGERRLQRVLRGQVPAAGDQALRVIIEAAEDHYRTEPVIDDITLVVVRTGMSQ